MVLMLSPPDLNYWLKNHGYYDNNTKKFVCTGYWPVADINWNAVALYGCSNGVLCFYDGLLNNADLKKQEKRIKDYICHYGPQIMGVEGSSKIMNTHWVSVYGWVSDEKGNVTDWLISDPADGRLKSLNDDPRYKGKYGDVHGFRFIHSNARINAPPSITFNMHSPAELLVIDSQGRRTGYDPATGQSYNEIPEASYIHHAGIEDPETGELHESDLKTLHILNPDPKKYKLVVTGTGNGTYSLDVIGYNQSYTETVSGYEDVPVTPLEVHTYDIQYDGYVDRFEAEAMVLYNYTVEDNSSASGEKLVKVTSNPASASFVYSGDPGVKDLAIWYYDQNNGHSTYQLYINNVLIDSWTTDQDLGSVELSAATRVSRVVSNIQLNIGDQIKIEGLMYGEERATIDVVEISKPLATLPRVAPLSFSLASGVYDSPQSVAIICDTGDAVIRYTTNGTTPNQTSSVYSGPIAVTSSMTLKAYASRNGFEDSEVISAKYTITNPSNRVAAPTFTPITGNYTFGRKVSIFCATEEATIRYTTDGSTPNASSPVYTGPVAVDQTTTFKAYASKDGIRDSDITTSTYTIKVTEPVITPTSGTYLSTQLVTIICPTRDAVIRYTTDGSMPNASSPIYTGPIKVEWNTRIRAYASITGLDNSDVVSANYVIKVNTPKLSLGSGTYYSPQSLTISCANSTATIHYTTDGSVPNASSPVYTGPITVDRTMTFTACALAPGLEDSNVVTANYILKVQAPVISPKTGNYSSGQTVTISCATSGATIRYTIDGSTPDASSLVYSEPITVAETSIIKAYAEKEGYTDSDIVTAVYLFSSIPNSLINPGFENGPGIGWTGNTADGHVSIDQTWPQTGSYSLHLGGYNNANDYAEQQVVIPASGILTYWWYMLSDETSDYTGYDFLNVSLYNTKGVLLKTFKTYSNILERGTWTLDGISLASYAGQEVILRFTCTTDSSLPTTFWIDNVSINSVTAPPTPVATPAFNPAGGTYAEAQSVTISCATDGATIRYTIDGSTPDSSSPVYTTPISITENTTIKAYATKTGMMDSEVATAIYEINIPQVAAPTINPIGGTYSGAQNITISCETEGVTIRYTVDGSIPNASSSVCTGPISVTKNTTVKAYATKTGMIDSAVATAIYEINISKVATPAFSPTGGICTSAQSITITCVTDGATIRYTIDGSIPNSSSSVYTGPITIAKNTTIKAYATKTGLMDSDMAAAIYEINIPQVATPTFNPAGGTYNGIQSVTISCATYDVTIRYTTDGSAPNASSPVYTGPIKISENTTINAYATKPGMVDSNVATAIYVINIPHVATPVFNPAGGTYTSAQSVTISCVTSDATIRYTVDGSTPNSSSPVFTTPITITENTTVKAYAYKIGMIDSEVATATYEINIPQVAKPVFSPEGGTYTEAQSITISCATKDAIIRYTTDGSVPNATSPIYNDPISITANTTIKAHATKTGMIDSNVATSVYVINMPQTVVTPTFLPGSGTYYWPQIVKIFCPTKGAIIRYTTDGSIPDSTSRIYTHPLMVINISTLKAYAVKPGYNDSNVATAIYDMKTAAPFFNLKPGTYKKPYKVKIFCPTKGAVIRYTTDGSDPDHSSPVYIHPIMVKETTIIKAYAYKHGYSNSEVITATYVIDNRPKAATPTSNPGSGIYISSREIRITSKTKEAIIRYTIDGTTPNIASPIFESPLTITKTTMFKAYASKEGYKDSGVSTAYYSILVAPPSFNPKGGTYRSVQEVKLSCDTNGATIRYTIDGTNPNALSAVYTDPISVSKNTKIKAYASKLGCKDSIIMTANYLIKTEKGFSLRSGTRYLAQRVLDFFRAKWATICFQMMKRFELLI